MLQTLRKPFQGNPPSRPLAPLGSQPPRPSVFKGIQGCSLPALKPLQTLQTLKTLKMLQTLRKPFQGNPPSRPLAPLGSQPPRPSVFKGIQGCRLPALKTLQNAPRWWLGGFGGNSYPKYWLVPFFLGDFGILGLSDVLFQESNMWIQSNGHKSQNWKGRILHNGAYFDIDTCNHPKIHPFHQNKDTGAPGLYISAPQIGGVGGTRALAHSIYNIPQKNHGSWPMYMGTSLRKRRNFSKRWTAELGLWTLDSEHDFSYMLWMEEILQHLVDGLPPYSPIFYVVS